LEKKNSELERKYAFSMELCEGMMKRMTNAKISISLLKNRLKSSPVLRIDLTEEDAEGEVDVLEAPITLGSHIVGSPKPDGMLLERIDLELELTWVSGQTSVVT